MSIGAHKLGTLVKVSEELLNDSAFDLEKYMAQEFARTAEDVVWRRSKLGLRMTEAQIDALQAFMETAVLKAAE